MERNLVSKVRSEQAQTKRILTFEEICPLWSDLIAQLGFRIAQMDGLRSKGLNMADPMHCIVGEGHGFNPEDNCKSGKYGGCKTCVKLGCEVICIMHEEGFEQWKSNFVEHWNSVHNKED